MKLVTVLVPRQAPATVPTASEIMACRARGSLLSRRKPACSHTPTSVPIVSNISMNRKTRTIGSIGSEDGVDDVHFEESRAERGAGRKDLRGHMEFLGLENHGESGGGGDAEEHGAFDAAGVEDGCHEQAGEENQQIRGGEVGVELHRASGVFDDEAAVLEANKGDEQADPGGKCRS